MYSRIWSKAWISCFVIILYTSACSKEPFGMTFSPIYSSKNIPSGSTFLIEQNQVVSPEKVVEDYLKASAIGEEKIAMRYVQDPKLLEIELQKPFLENETDEKAFSLTDAREPKLRANIKMIEKTTQSIKIRAEAQGGGKKTKEEMISFLFYLEKEADESWKIKDIKEEVVLKFYRCDANIGAFRTPVLYAREYLLKEEYQQKGAQHLLEKLREINGVKLESISYEGDCVVAKVSQDMYFDFKSSASLVLYNELIKTLVNLPNVKKAQISIAEKQGSKSRNQSRDEQFKKEDIENVFFNEDEFDVRILPECFAIPDPTGKFLISPYLEDKRRVDIAVGEGGKIFPLAFLREEKNATGTLEFFPATFDRMHGMVFENIGNNLFKPENYILADSRHFNQKALLKVQSMEAMEGSSKANMAQIQKVLGQKPDLIRKVWKLEDGIHVWYVTSKDKLQRNAYFVSEDPLGFRKLGEVKQKNEDRADGWVEWQCFFAARTMGGFLMAVGRGQGEVIYLKGYTLPV